MSTTRYNTVKAAERALELALAGSASLRGLEHLVGSIEALRDHLGEIRRRTDAPAWFTNWGSRIDVAAPGVDVVSTRASGTSLGAPAGDGYARLSGTSMAAPHVAGLAALVLARHPGFSTEEVRQAIRVSAIDIGRPGLDEESGHGRVDAPRAVGVDRALAARILDPPDGATVRIRPAGRCRRQRRAD